MTGARRPTPNEEPASLATTKTAPDDAAAIDLAHLDRQCFGDRDLAGELLAAFRAQALTLARRLAEEPGLAFAAQADLAHRLRGSALAVGAFRVARAAEAVEAFGRSPNGVARGHAAAAELSQAVLILLDAVLRAAGAIDRMQA